MGVYLATENSSSTLTRDPSTSANSADSEKIQLFGVPISRCGIDETLEQCQSKIEEVSPEKRGYVCFVNVHTLTESLYSEPLRRALRSAWLAVADGVPLVWLSRLKNSPIRSRVCGPDFMLHLINNQYSKHPTLSAREQKLTFGFIGGSKSSTDQLIKNLGFLAPSSSPEHSPVIYNPPMRPFTPENAREDWKEFLKQWDDKKPGEYPKVVWVGLGAPKQELWMEEVSQIAPQTLFFGVGAAFDFLAGNKKRAPLWMQRMGLEWLFRLCSEPRRLWKRYLVTNSVFIFYSFFDLLNSALAKFK